MSLYSIIYADPPWAYLWGTGKDGGNFAPEKHYPTMQTDEICALPIKSIREKNCALAMWTTSPCLPDAFKVMKAWGFKYKTVLFTWVKQNPKALTVVTGAGSYTRSACEYVLLGMRGHIKRVSTDVISQVVFAPRTGHSRKPPIIREHLVSLFGDLSRIELFARSQTSGWDVFGNQVEGSIRLPTGDANPLGGSRSTEYEAKCTKYARNVAHLVIGSSANYPAPNKVYKDKNAKQ